MSTAMNPPRVVKFADIRVGQKVERTHTSEDGTERIRRGVVTIKTDHAAENGTAYLAWPDDDRKEHVTLRVLEEPSAPALPTAPGTVIDCTLDGDPGAVLVVNRLGAWTGVWGDGTFVEFSSSTAPDRITNWTVRPKPEDQS